MGFLDFFLMRGIDATKITPRNAFSRKKFSDHFSGDPVAIFCLPPFPESGSRKRFHGSGVRAIDSPPRKT